MKETTKHRKESIKGLGEINGRHWITEQMYRIFVMGKQGFDSMMKDLGRMMAEAIMYIEREEVAGPDYKPFSPEVQKWASQPGSVYIGDQKVQIEHPRLRGKHGEIQLKSYERLKDPEGFSEELLTKVLRGISCQKYIETIVQAAQAFGVSASSVSQHIIRATTEQRRNS